MGALGGVWQAIDSQPQSHLQHEQNNSGLPYSAILRLAEIEGFQNFDMNLYVGGILPRAEYYLNAR